MEYIHWISNGRFTDFRKYLEAEKKSDVNVCCNRPVRDKKFKNFSIRRLIYTRWTFRRPWRNDSSRRSDWVKRGHRCPQEAISLNKRKKWLAMPPLMYFSVIYSVVITAMRIFFIGGTNFSWAGKSRRTSFLGCASLFNGQFSIQLQGLCRNCFPRKLLFRKFSRGGTSLGQFVRAPGHL